jgi:hypothetical protein
MTLNMLLRSRTPIPMSCNMTAQSGGLNMSDSGSGNGGAWRSGGAPDFQPHAFDPWMQPELFRGVLTRRVFAFLIDIVVLAIPVILACMFIAVFGVVTLGLGWALFWLVSPASVIWALIYYGASLAAFGHPGHARDGSRAAHLVRRAGLFRAGRHACRAVLDFGFGADAAGSADRAVQRPPAAVARYHPGNRGYQQLGPQPRRAAGANVLNWPRLTLGQTV